MSTCLGAPVINPSHLNVLMRNNFFLSNFDKLQFFIQSVFAYRNLYHQKVCASNLIVFLLEVAYCSDGQTA